MKFIVEGTFPHEPFNTYVRDGTIGEKIGATLQAIAPEVIYFTDSGVGRGLLMIVDLKDASQAPHVTGTARHGAVDADLQHLCSLPRRHGTG